MRADEENTGTVEYDKYEEIVGEVLEAKQAQSQAEEALSIKKD